MKKVRLLGFLWAFGFLTFCFSQTPKQLAQDIINTPELYIWGEGQGETIEEADQQALFGITSQISLSVESQFSSVSEWGKGKDLKDNLNSVITTYSAATLNGAKRLIINDEPDAKILRYIKKENITKIFEAREKKIQEFIQLADKYLKQLKIGDALRYYYWGFLLLKSHPEQFQIKYNEKNILLSIYINEKMNEIFDNTSITVNENFIQKDKQIVEIQFLYKNKIPQNISYNYWTGKDWTIPEFAANGESVLEFFGTEKKNTEIKIEYAFKNELRIDKEMETIQKSIKNPFFKRAKKRNISFQKSDDKKVTLPSEKIAEIKNEINLNTNEKSVTLKNKNNDKNNEIIDKNVLTSFETLGTILDVVQQKEFEKITPLTTKEGKKMTTQLLKHGNAYIMQYDTLTGYTVGDDMKIYAVPFKFSFPNNATNFTEKIVFHFDKNEKLNDITFALSEITQNSIMNYEKWNIEDRRILVDFLEHYKTAYALKRINYLSSIFSDNALIIVGRILKTESNLENRYLNNKIVVKNRYTKEQYMKQLAYSFKSKEFINLRFEDIDIRRSAKNKNIYGIKVRQRYFSSNYGDIGYLFLLVDLENKNKPTIHIRTWQENKNFDENLYGINDF